jgi:hypothetical protein
MAIIVLLGNFRIKTLFPMFFIFLFFCGSPSSSLLFSVQDESNVNNALFLYYTIKGVRLYAVKMAIIVLLANFRIKTLFSFFFFLWVLHPLFILCSSPLLTI